METKYSELAESVRREILMVPSVCLTMDGWTEPHTTQSFLGVTVHYAYGNEFRSAMLGVQPLSSAHTSKYLKEEILSYCNEWRINPSEVSHVVTDNAPNIVLAAKEAFGTSKHLGCFNHKLNLIAGAAVDTKTVGGKQVPNVQGVPELIKKVKNIVTFSHTSYNFANELKRVQLERGASEGTILRLLQDVITRWNSTYLTCKRFLQMQRIVSEASLKFPDIVMLTSSELATLESILNLLWPFYDATVEMSSEKTTTASKIIPMVSMIYQAS